MEFENELLDRVFQIDEYNNEIWKRNRQPLVATFELTPNCNLKCIHCYLGKHRVEDNMLSFEQVKEILNQLADAGVLHLALTGGECTIRKDLPQIYEYAKKKGFLVTVFTNGVDISEDMYQMFRKYPPFYVDISLYGASEDTYESITGKRVFAKVMKTFERLTEEGIVFGIKTPIMKQNQDDYENMCKIADKYNVPYRTGYVMLSTIDAEDYPIEFMIPASKMIQLEVRDKVMTEIGFKDADVVNPWDKRFNQGEFVPLFICNPGVNDVIVDFKGNICPCAGYRHIGKNIFESSFKEIWESYAYLKKIPATEKNKCIHCQSRFFCRVCPAEQELKTGELESITPEICEFAHAKKMYYKDRVSLETILDVLDEKNNCKDYLINCERGCKHELQ